MKLYRISYHNDYSDRGNGIAVEYFGTKRAAKTRMRAITEEFTPTDPELGEDDAGFSWYTPEPEIVDVPLTKAALIAFLNRATN